MKKTFILILVLSGVLSSCNNEIELYGGGDPVPIVYCLLNPNADVQYVRSSRSYQIDSSCHTHYACFHHLPVWLGYSLAWVFREDEQLKYVPHYDHRNMFYINRLTYERVDQFPILPNVSVRYSF